jgi:hypothetical protein
MIYSEDAPALENKLHKHFESRRVNMVNMRREFFKVTLDEIRGAIEKHFGEVTFRVTPEAEEFRKTVALWEDMASTVGRPRAATAAALGRTCGLSQASVSADLPGADLLSLAGQASAPPAPFET